MTHEELLQRISIDPAICGGKPCIRGHRIWVSLIVDFLASGMSVEDIPLYNGSPSNLFGISHHPCPTNSRFAASSNAKTRACRASS